MTGGPGATLGVGRLAVRPAQACAETSSRGIVPERSGSTHQVRGQFRDAVAECVATTRRRCPQGAIFSGPPEKTHPPARETAGPHLAPRGPSQWRSEERRVGKECTSARGATPLNAYCNSLATRKP